MYKNIGPIYPSKLILYSSFPFLFILFILVLSLRIIPHTIRNTCPLIFCSNLALPYFTFTHCSVLSWEVTYTWKSIITCLQSSIALTIIYAQYLLVTFLWSVYRNGNYIFICVLFWLSIFLIRLQGPWKKGPSLFVFNVVRWAWYIFVLVSEYTYFSIICSYSIRGMFWF